MTPEPQTTEPRCPDAVLPVSEGTIDGNIFGVIGAARRAILEAGYDAETASQMVADVTAAESYDDALRRVCRWVSIA